MGDPRFTADGRFDGYGGRRCVHQPRDAYRALCYVCGEWCYAPLGDPARDALAPCAGCTPIPDEPPDESEADRADCASAADRLSAEADRLRATTGLYAEPARKRAGEFDRCARWLRGESDV